MLLELFPFVILNNAMAFVNAYIQYLDGPVNWYHVQLLMKQADTLPTHCRHIEHMHEAVWLENILLTK